MKHILREILIKIYLHSRCIEREFGEARGGKIDLCGTWKRIKSFRKRWDGVNIMERNF